MSKLSELLIRHEGLRLKPYRDSVGKLTIGVGRNLDDVGISEREAYILLEADINKAHHGALKIFPGMSDSFSGVVASPVRQDVIVNMIFNLGLTRFRKFKKMIAAVKAKDWNRAADEMLDSKWASQVGRRARELAKMMRTGKYGED